MKTPKRPRDPAQLAKLIVDIATGEVEEKVAARPNPASQKGGLAGGPARALKLVPEKRKDIAQNAAKARWGKARFVRETSE
jgi:hypothetical protein